MKKILMGVMALGLGVAIGAGGFGEKIFANEKDFVNQPRTNMMQNRVQDMNQFRNMDYNENNDYNSSSNYNYNYNHRPCHSYGNYGNYGEVK